jgi:hypothetical protein
VICEREDIGSYKKKSIEKCGNDSLGGEHTEEIPAIFLKSMVLPIRSIFNNINNSPNINNSNTGSSV